MNQRAVLSRAAAAREAARRTQLNRGAKRAPIASIFTAQQPLPVLLLKRLAPRGQGHLGMWELEVPHGQRAAEVFLYRAEDLLGNARPHGAAQYSSDREMRVLAS
jgi:hypothetical protein